MKNEIKMEINEENFVSNFAFPVVIKNREKIVKRLIGKGVEVRPLIAGDMSQKPMWLDKYPAVNLPNCRLINEFGFYVPNHQGLTTEEVLKVAGIINE